VLHVSEDAYQGDAQFTVKVDGVNVGTYTAHAAHGSGQWEDVTVTGNFGAAGPNKVDVTFLNDAWGGGWPNDRNLYVDYIDVNGHKVRGESQASATVNGSAAALYGNGTLSFDTHGSAPAASSGTSTVLSTTTTAPAATPSPSTTTGSTTTTSGTPVIAKLDAVATPAGAHAYVPPDWSGVTKGSAGADDLYTSGAHQTLIGNGGDDIFHIGTNIDAKIVVGSTGVTTVSTWAPAYTLADGVNDLKAEGDYVHNLTGNAGHNWITGGNGNDVLNGGAGNDVLQVGTGANQLTGGAGNDMFIFSKAADHDNVIHDFARGQDMLDLRGAVASTGYNGADAVKDGILKLAAAGDGTVISIDSDGANGQPAHTLVTIEHVAPSALKAGADFLWH
jgi:Ca2+-binding RTX toxin-like protein